MIPPKHTCACSRWDFSSSSARAASSSSMRPYVSVHLCGRSNTLIVLFLVVGIQMEVSQHRGPDPAWDAAGKNSWQPLECSWTYEVNWALTSAPWEGSAAKTQHRPPTGLSSEAYIRQWSVQTQQYEYCEVCSQCCLVKTCNLPWRDETDTEMKRGAYLWVSSSAEVISWFIDRKLIFLSHLSRKNVQHSFIAASLIWEWCFPLFMWL